MKNFLDWIMSEKTHIVYALMFAIGSVIGFFIVFIWLILCYGPLAFPIMSLMLLGIPVIAYMLRDKK